MRSIKAEFIKDLQDGSLAPFLKEIKENRDKFSLEIRKNYISIYYKGGRLLKITSHSRKGYEFTFDSKYCLHKADTSSYETIRAFDPYSVETFSENLPLLLKEMDTWFLEHPKPERDFQHRLLVSNPEIIDIEYQVGRRMRLDMLAFHEGKIIVIENKYGNGAISGNAGLAKHYADMCEILGDSPLYKDMADSVVKISEAKYALGLSDRLISESEISGKEILFLLAGYNKNSSAASNEAEKMDRSIPAKMLLMSEDESIIRWDTAYDLF